MSPRLFSLLRCRDQQSVICPSASHSTGRDHSRSPGPGRVRARRESSAWTGPGRPVLPPRQTERQTVESNTFAPRDPFASPRMAPPCAGVEPSSASREFRCVPSHGAPGCATAGARTLVGPPSAGRKNCRRIWSATALRASPSESSQLCGRRRRSSRAAGRRSTGGAGSAPCDRCRGIRSGSAS